MLKDGDIVRSKSGAPTQFAIKSKGCRVLGGELDRYGSGVVLLEGQKGIYPVEYLERVEEEPTLFDMFDNKAG